MATSFSVLLLSISITFFLLLLNKVNSEETISFSITKFDEPTLILQGDAVVTETGLLQLTTVENYYPLPNSLGRALYSAPIHIWDNATGEAASFVTTFDFVIDPLNYEKTAQGLAFFLAPVDTQPQKGGGYLGLFSDDTSDPTRKIVAVEFDTFYNNKWDAEKRPHIGVDVNSIRSIETTPWDLWDFGHNILLKATITYDASINTITVSLNHPYYEKKSHILSVLLDLKEILPEWVRIGFSAASGPSKDYTESHDIVSWSFDSKLSHICGDDIQKKNKRYAARSYLK